MIAARVCRAATAAPVEAPPKEDEQKDEDTATIHIPQYHVILLDDDDHSYEYVIEMLGDVFGHSPSKAYRMAVNVDNNGRVIVETTNKERAGLRKKQVEAYGPDWRIPRCKGSMSATIEPAET